MVTSLTNSVTHFGTSIHGGQSSPLLKRAKLLILEPTLIPLNGTNRVDKTFCTICSTKMTFYWHNEPIIECTRYLNCKWVLDNSFSSLEFSSLLSYTVLISRYTQYIRIIKFMNNLDIVFTVSIFDRIYCSICALSLMMFNI